jgi:hypothetical protein
MAITLPIEILYLLEEKIGKEEAKKVSSAIVLSLDTIENKAKDTAVQKKLELRDELSKELASKADVLQAKTELRAEILLVETRLNAKIDAVRAEIQQVRTELKADILNLEWKMKLYFVILLCAIFLTNHEALGLITKIIGIAK